MSLEELVSTYGYAAIGIGAFLEGETILVLGGFSAHRGYLELPWVIFYAFLGSFIGDQAYFYIGRAKGKELLVKFPRMQSKSKKVFSLLSRHQILMILGFRFLYGLRTVTPFMLGAAKISPPRFFILNFIGASVWAIVIGTMGYLFGQVMEILIDDLKRYEWRLFVVIAVVGLAIWLGHLILKRGVG
jgi:membrane protein DedA with SNARE-associated domain